MRGCPTILFLAALASPIRTPAAAQEPAPFVRVPVRPPPARVAQLPRRPRVVGLTYAEAESLLHRLHVTVVRRDSIVESGPSQIVLHQSPLAGTPVKRDAVDTLIVSRGSVSRRGAIPGLMDVPPLARLPQLPQRPSVVGRTYAEAESLLQRLRITVVRRDSLVASGSDAIVLGQSPLAGTPVTRGAVDTLTVSRVRAPRRVDVPNVVEAPYRVAVRRILGAGLAPAGPTLTPEDSARARVVRQDPPAPGPAPLGSPVKLAVALDDRTPVPRVVGTDTATARRILARAELLTAPFTLEFHDRFGAGLVVHQDPPAGDSVKRGSAVRLRVSRGPHPDTTLVLVPSVLRLSLDRARATLEAHRLAMGHADTLERADGEGRVVSQDPHPGDTAHVGDAVRLTLTVPHPTVPVPRLLGLTRARARDTLESVGLTLGAVRIVTDSARPDSLVVGQSVAPGTRLPLREPVGIDLNLRPRVERVVVPRVLGLRLPEASESIVRSRLTVGRVTERPSRRSDIVLDQAPQEGERVAPGFAVSLVIGRDTTPTESARSEVVPEPLVRTPAVVDTALPRAIAILEEAGLRHTVVDSQPAPETAVDWVVVAQAPQAGEMVLATRLVQLQARAIATAPVPDLIGLSEGEAGAAATSEGFGFRVVSRTTGLRLAGTRVTAQEPAAFSRIAAGTPIDVTVAYPLPPLVRLGIGLAGLAGAAAVVRKVRPLKPRFRTSVTSEPPELACAEETLAKAEVALQVQVEVQSPEVECGGEALILREERRHA